MKILVTGGAGFIGSNLISHLLEQTEHSVLNLDALTYAGNLSSIQDFEGNSKYQFAKHNICDAKAVEAVFREFKPDWVMHLAAESHVDRSIGNPDAFIQTNITGTFNLLQSARARFDQLRGEEKSNFRFLHVSTDEVYGSLGSEGLFNEQTAYDPHSPYSASKAAADHLVRAWRTTYGLPVLITNCSNNYGPYQFPEKLIPVVILSAIAGKQIPVYGQGTNVRDWLYVGDHCDALCTVISKGSIGQTYTIGGNNERKNIDLVRLLCSLLDEIRPRPDGKSYSEQITLVPDRLGHDLRYAIDTSKIRTELQWYPKQDHNLRFRETLQWYLENLRWAKDMVNRAKQLDWS